MQREHPTKLAVTSVQMFNDDVVPSQHQHSSFQANKHREAKIRNSLGFTVKNLATQSIDRQGVLYGRVRKDPFRSGFLKDFPKPNSMHSQQSLGFSCFHAVCLSVYHFAS